MIPLVVISSLWALCVGVFRAVTLTRLGETEQRAAMAREALPRAGPLIAQLSDGIKIWDPDRRYYSTFQYACWPAGAGPAPFR